jgi:hypothetical protein
MLDNDKKIGFNKRYRMIKEICVNGVTSFMTCEKNRLTIMAFTSQLCRRF